MNNLRLKKLYAKTIKESPYFCDQMLPDWDHEIIEAVANQNFNKSHHRLLAGYERHNLMWNEILDNAVWDATRHLAYDEKDKAIESLYGAMVVLMRTLDVLEGKQKLGRTNDAGNKSEK